MSSAFQSATVGALTTELVTDEAGWLTLAPEWDRVLERSSTRTPFQTFEWLEAWRKTMGVRYSLFVIVIRTADELRAIAPLCLHPDGVVRFLGDSQNDFADLILRQDDDEALKAIIDTLARERSRYARVELDQIPEHSSPWDRLVSVAGDSGLPARSIRVGECPMMPLADEAAARKLYYKRNITTYINRFKKRGDLAYAEFTHGDSFDKTLEALFEQHVHRWSETPFPSAFLNPVMRDFYREFLSALKARDRVSLVGLTLDSEFLALYVYFKFERVFYMYKTSFNLDYRTDSPGQVILRFILDSALEDGATELNYGRGNEGYKSRFASESRYNRRVVLYKHDWERRRDDLVYQLKQSPMVRRIFERGPLAWIRARLS